MRDWMGRCRARLARSVRGCCRTRILLAVLPLLLGCQNTDDILEPTGGDASVLHAVYRSDEGFIDNPIVMDGQMIEVEWGGTEVPFYNVRVSSENGAGNASGPAFISLKAVYTDRDLFLLVRWADEDVDALKDAMVYVGDSLAFNLGGECQPSLLSESNWIRDWDDFFDEDRISIAFEMDSAGNAIGSFREHGCLVVCHQQETPRFGRLEYGKLDVWQWLASRTNPVRNIYVDTDNPETPLYGIPGYLDDLVSDAYSGLTADPGTPSYRPNFTEGSDVPVYVYRERDDPFAHPVDPDRCWNAFGERCRKNNGVAMAYTWREQIELQVDPFSECDTVLSNPLPVGTAPHKWSPLDIVAGWILTYPTESRADVHGRAGYEDGIWTLEIGRRLNTGDPLHDVIFEPDSQGGVVFTMAVMDNSGEEHLGSEPQVLVFDPKPEEK